MDNDQKENIRKQVSDHYARVAEQGANVCRGVRGDCCGQSSIEISDSDLALGIGYTARQIGQVPDEANLGLGCGNPLVIAGIREGETVLDLGCGAGLDSLLAARQVGEKGRVIGVDLTEEMIKKARENARFSGCKNVDFRFGEIERLPIPDNSIDVIISNCVINLSPDKGRVFAEAFRVLKPGGRLGIFDVVATAPLPDEIKKDLSAYVGCIAGAVPLDELKDIMNSAGFERIQIDLKEKSREFIREWMPGKGAEKYVVSAAITGVKPLST
ncbi:MAG: arsenite methyltransferase, partial [Candidatus Zixiibacteriota bacterium]